VIALQRRSTVLGAFAFTIMLFVGASLYSPSGFGSRYNLQSVAIFAAFTGFAALGQTIIVIAGGLDLSIPWTMALGGIGVVLLAGKMPFVPAVILVLLIGLGIGTINGALVTVLGAPPLIVTLAVGAIIEGAIIAVDTTVEVGAGAVPATDIHLANATIGRVPVFFLLWFVVAAFVGVMLTRTPLGRKIYAVGANPRAARLAGIRVKRVQLITYSIGGVASTFAGILLAGYVQTTYIEMGQNYLFASVAAVALGGTALLGGTGSYWGTFAGAVTLAGLSAFLPMLGLNGASVDIAYGIVIIVGMYLSRGLQKLATMPLPSTDLGERERDNDE
jgi:ribose transport system permease protein